MTMEAITKEVERLRGVIAELRAENNRLRACNKHRGQTICQLQRLIVEKNNELRSKSK